MQILIIEDDKFAVKMLLNLLRENDVEAQVTVAYSLKEARSFIADKHYNLFFLDVHLQDGLGTDIINEFPANAQVVFITGDPNYAVQAFEHNALDYIVKPVDKERFEKTLQRLKEKDEEENSLVIRADYQFHKVRADDILYVKSNGDYLTVVTEDQKFTFYGRLKNFLEKLPEASFRQCHRSYIINFKKARGMHQQNVLLDGVEIPVSSSYKKEITALFDA